MTILENEDLTFLLMLEFMYIKLPLVFSTSCAYACVAGEDQALAPATKNSKLLS